MAALSISGMTWWTSDADLYKLCVDAKCSSKIPQFITFQENITNGKSMGIAQMDFQLEEDCLKLLNYLQSTSIHGRKVTVELKKWDQNKQTPMLLDQSKPPSKLSSRLSENPSLSITNPRSISRKTTRSKSPVRNPTELTTYSKLSRKRSQSPSTTLKSNSYRLSKQDKEKMIFESRNDSKRNLNSDVKKKEKSEKDYSNKERQQYSKYGPRSTSIRHSYRDISRSRISSDKTRENYSLYSKENGDDYSSYSKKYSDSRSSHSKESKESKDHHSSYLKRHRDDKTSKYSDEKNPKEGKEIHSKTEKSDNIAQKGSENNKYITSPIDHYSKYRQFSKN